MRGWYKGKRNRVKITRIDYWFSRYIRIRDAYPNGYAHCCTCNKIFHWKEMQCGHFVSRKYLNTRYHEKNCHAQCKICNINNDGELGKYALFLDKKYGIGTAQTIIDLSEIHVKNKRTTEYFKQLKNNYKIKATELATEKGIEI